VTIPTVKGLSLSSAQSLLSAINVTPVVVYRQTSDPTLDGIVFGVSPNSGTVVLEGTSATLYVWQGPAPSPSPSPSPGGGNGNGHPGHPGNGNGNGNGH
jgi:beta-lactam-binding protein with PASTA domain